MYIFFPKKTFASVQAPVRVKGALLPLLNLRNSPLWFKDPFIYVLMLYHACSCCEEPFGVNFFEIGSFADDNNIQTRGIISSPNAVNPSPNRQSSNANESMLHFADDNNIQTRGVISSPNAVNPSSNRQSSNANKSMLHFADDNNIQTIQVISSPKAVNVTEKESTAGPGGKSPGDRKLSSKEEDAILNVYDDLIRSSDQIVTDHVRCSMKNHPSLRVLVPIPGMVKKVVD